jgi:hypothetical protein
MISLSSNRLIGSTPLTGLPKASDWIRYNTLFIHRSSSQPIPRKSILIQYNITIIMADNLFHNITRKLNTAKTKSRHWQRSWVMQLHLSSSKSIFPRSSLLFLIYYFLTGSRDISIAIPTDYGLHGRSSIPSMGKGFLSSPQGSNWLWLTRPPTQWLPDALSPKEKRPGREADHSPPRSGMVELYLHSTMPIHGLVLN